MGVTNDFTAPETIALAGIEAVERFYHAIGMPISIEELLGRRATDDEIKEMVRKCSHNGTLSIGHFKVLSQTDMDVVYRMANGE